MYYQVEHWSTYTSFYTGAPSETEVAQSCLTHCDLMDHSLPGSSVHGIFQLRVLEWVAISFSRESFRPRDPTLQADALLYGPPGKRGQ